MTFTVVEEETPIVREAHETRNNESLAEWAERKEEKKRGEWKSASDVTTEKLEERRVPKRDGGGGE